MSLIWKALRSRILDFLRWAVLVSCWHVIRLGFISGRLAARSLKLLALALLLAFPLAFAFLRRGGCGGGAGGGR